MEVHVVFNDGKELKFNSIKEMKQMCFDITKQYYTGVIDTLKSVFNQDIKMLMLDKARVI